MNKMKFSDYIGSAIFISVVLSGQLQEMLAGTIRAFIDKFGYMGFLWIILLSQLDRLVSVAQFTLGILFQIFKFLFVMYLRISQKVRIPVKE